MRERVADPCEVVAVTRFAYRGAGQLIGLDRPVSVRSSRVENEDSYLEDAVQAVEAAPIIWPM